MNTDKEKGKRGKGAEAFERASAAVKRSTRLSCAEAVEMGMRIDLLLGYLLKRVEAHEAGDRVGIEFWRAMFEANRPRALELLERSMESL